MKKVPNRKVKVKLNKIILQILLLILVSSILITQKENILNIFTNKNKIKADIPGDMRIGDIIKYDHKTGVKPEDLKTTIGKGTASIPGSTYEQTFDASTIDTTWRVFNIDKDNKEIMIVSDSIYPEFRTKGAIDYIWYEHNMHKIASIFGHGKGAKNKAFTYKVGSQLEDTGDTATWKTGIDGIPLTTPNGIPGITTKEGLKDIAAPLSGARPLRTEDIEKAFGWTESTIKTDSKFSKNGSTGYGGIYTKNIHFPQRDTGNSTQQWADKNIAKATKQDVRGKDGWYYIEKSNVPENNYKKVLWDWNNAGSKTYYQLGQLGLDVYSIDVGFLRGMVYSGGFYSANDAFVGANADGYWYEYARTIPGRVAAFLSSSDIVYRKSSAFGAHQEQIWEIQEKQTLPKGMKIGDIVKYDHKETGVKIEDKRLANLGDNQDLLKTTIEKGTATVPGSTYKQDFDANKIDTNWHVWGVDEVTGDVIIASDSISPKFKQKGAIDYIWYEHNMHKIASIFGHGKGAKKKEFTYKVGSQLEGPGDTATWKTGIDGIPLTSPKGIPGITTKEGLKDIAVPLSGARPLRTEDIEKAFGWTESTIKIDSKFNKNTGTGYGGIYTQNVYFPQRDTGNSTQQWSDKNIAKAAKQDVKGKDRGYGINKSDVPENNYKKVLWDLDNAGGKSSYELGQTGMVVVDSGDVYFGRGMVNLNNLESSDWGFVYVTAPGDWYEYDDTYSYRVVAFLSSSDITYRKINDVGVHQEPVWDIELINNPSKNIKFNVINEYGKDITGAKINLNIGDSNTSLVSKENISVNSGKVGLVNVPGVVMKDSKYKMEVLGLPIDANYKIISKYNGDHELEQDIVSFGKEDLEYDILIYRKDGDYPVSVTYDEGAENDEGFSLDGKIKLMDGKNLVDTLDVTLKKGNTEFKFTDVKYFVDGKFKNYTIKYEGEGEGDVKVDGNALNVKYTPPKKNYTIKAEFIFDKTLDSVPVKLFANGKPLKDIELLKSAGYITSENLPERDKTGNPITYTIQKGNISSGYITEISGLTIIIRPVLTLPMSGSDSIKMLGITAGICTILGLGVRAKNKLAVFFKKYEIMK